MNKYQDITPENAFLLLKKHQETRFSYFEYTPLQFVCSNEFVEENSGNKLAIIKSLLAAKADVNADNGGFTTPLREALYHKEPNFDVIRTLVEAKAKLATHEDLRCGRGNVLHLIGRYPREWVGGSNGRYCGPIHLRIAELLLKEMRPWSLFELDGVQTLFSFLTA